jgi:SagB-type dehydrogenase family enzyme
MKMKKETLAILALASFAIVYLLFHYTLSQYNDKAVRARNTLNSQLIVLPEPNLKGEVSVEMALAQRRSRREYSRESLSLSELSRLLWAAQGLSGEMGRTAPSAGATYPLEVYAVVGDVSGLSSGLYHYLPQEHSLTLLKSGDFRENLSAASLNQKWVSDAPASLVLTAVYERTTRQYGERGIRYVHMEAGHAAENVYLQAEALGLGTVSVGAFDDKAVSGVLGLPEGETPLYVMPVGKRV